MQRNPPYGSQRLCYEIFEDEVRLVLGCTYDKICAAVNKENSISQKVYQLPQPMERCIKLTACRNTTDLPNTRYCKADGVVKRDGVSLAVQISPPVSPCAALCDGFGGRVEKVPVRAVCGQFGMDLDRCSRCGANRTCRRYRRVDKKAGESKGVRCTPCRLTSVGRADRKRLFPPFVAAFNRGGMWSCKVGCSIGLV